MSADPLLAGLWAARQVLEQSNPELLAWTTQQWQYWLEAQRRVETNGQPRLVAVAVLAGVEDLHLHVGLMQLLASQGRRCTVILTFPTDETACIARAEARRGEWHALVHIMPKAELAEALQGLSTDAMLAFFPMPVVLPLQALTSIVGSVRAAEANVYDDPGFFGLASDFAARFDTMEPIDEDGLVPALRAVLAADPKELAVVPGSAFSVELEQTRAKSQVVMRPRDGGIELIGPWDSGELLVSSVRGAASSSVVVRQRRELLDPDEPVRVRMPASFLTVAPQRIYIESRDADGGVAARNLQFHVPPSRLEPWMLSAFLNRGGGGNPVVRAFAHGVGCRIAYAEDEPSELQDIPVVWGVLRQSDRIVAQAKAQGLYFFYIDHAYFDRGHGKAYRITRNAYEAGPVRNCPSDRFSELAVEVRPWRQSGREIIVCPPTDYFMQAHGCADWLETTLATLRSVTDRPVTVRVKPQPGEVAVPLGEALETAHALVTHSSNAAIEAVCMGTPVFVSAGSAAAPVGLTDLSQIESPTYPDREAWLAHLAYNQFSFDEIGDGRAWRMLLELEEREFV